MVQVKLEKGAMDKIEKAIADLEEVVAGVEAGEVPERFVEGFGLQSRWFSFRWSDEVLALDFNLPCWRVLSSDEDRGSDDAEIAAACRMGMLLLAARRDGGLLRAEDGEASLSAFCSEHGARFTLRDAEGNVLDSGGWSVLVARLESVFALGAGSPAVSVFYP